MAKTIGPNSSARGPSFWPSPSTTRPSVACVLGPRSFWPSPSTTRPSVACVLGPRMRLNTSRHGPLFWWCRTSWLGQLESGRAAWIAFYNIRSCRRVNLLSIVLFSIVCYPSWVRIWIRSPLKVTLACVLLSILLFCLYSILNRWNYKTENDENTSHGRYLISIVHRLRFWNTPTTLCRIADQFCQTVNRWEIEDYYENKKMKLLHYNYREL